MQQGFFHVPDVSRLKIHGASTVTSRHHSHSSLTRDVVLPFVGVGVPVQLTQPSRVKRDHCHRNISRNLEVARINDAYLSAFRAFGRWHFYGAKSEITRRL